MNSQNMPSPSGAVPPSSGSPAGSVCSFSPGHGDSQPPRNMTDASAEIRIMFMYSARKNTANATPEYSTWKPATISDSPSATSNGWRFVAATPEMKYTTNSGNSQNQFHARNPPC